MDPPGQRQRYATGGSHDGECLAFNDDAVIDTQRFLAHRARHVNDDGVTHGPADHDITDVAASDDVDSACNDRATDDDITHFTACDDNATRDDDSAGDNATGDDGACPGRAGTAAHGACARGDARRAGPARR